MQELGKIIGSDYDSSPLKPLSKRIKQRLKMPRHRQPVVSLIVAQTGEKYKLLSVSEKNKEKVKRIQENAAILMDMDFVPRILFMDDHHILMEFVEGQVPDLQAKEFVIAFARNLAHVHNEDTGVLPAEEFNEEIRNDLSYLVNENALTGEVAQEILEKMMALQPEEIRTSMVYGDLKASNFVFNQDKLFFVDLGSFQSNRVTGLFLFGSKLFSNIDKGLFKESYYEAGGNEDLFKAETYFSIASYIQMSAYQLRTRHKHPFYDWRRKRARRDKAERLLEELKRHLTPK